MTNFRDIAAEDIAVQHQWLIDMILHVMSQGSAELREQIACSIDRMVAALGSEGRDTTLLADAAASLRRQDDEA